ncbi:uncharacterized protein LOC132301651 [Cornus florida]|uniref:uncharacterized protein LOC132301651 n=1 Tax=Cornus florida TaxID=4283 RepID=UPI00289D8DAD|nr:uncharacterized protein LOC132301651 [Cornus florida]
MDIVNLKMEKANAIKRYRRLQKITALLRFFELCVVLILIPRFSTQLPVISRLSGEYFRGLSTTLFSPRFVFIIGNAIVITLLVKSGHHSNSSSTSTVQDDSTKINSSRIYDLCNDGVEKNRNSDREQSTCVEVPTMLNTCEFGSKERKIVRSHSEEYFVEAKGGRELRHSATERCPKSVNYGEKAAVMEEEMSSEEFRRTVEAFIAKQQKSLREEVVLFE